MTDLEEDYLLQLLNSNEKEQKANKIPVLPLDVYLDIYLTNADKEGEITYPYVVNVARDIDYMLKTGDFSPKETLIIDKPPVWNGKKLWTRSSLKGIDLGFGLQNSDKRKLSRYKLGNPGNLSGPHMHIAGKTGGGKSVFVDALMSNLITAYSPYELEIMMIDAKVAGAGKYILKDRDGGTVPNIQLIAGTLDASYVVSVLEQMNARSQKLNRLFSMVNVDNLKDFREKTGLTIARTLILVDEYQLQYQNASPSDAELLTNEYDKILTAGRSAGVHLVLCTQKFVRELLSKFFHNIEIRATLTCASDTSVATLNNNMASQCKNIGEVHVNQLAVHEQSAEVCLENTHMYKVPFQDSLYFEKWLTTIYDAIGKHPHVKALNVYNEDSVIFKKDVEALVNKYKAKDRLILGEPGFMKGSEVDVFYRDLDFKDAETFMYYSPSRNKLLEFANTVAINSKHVRPLDGNVYFIIGDKHLMNEIEIPENAKVLKVLSRNDDYFISICARVFERLAIVSSDERLFQNLEVDASSIEAIKELFNKEGITISDINIARFQAYKKYYTDNLGTLKHILLGYNAETFATNCMHTLMELPSKFANTQITEENIPTLYLNFIGIDRVVGIGRDADYNASVAFRSMIGQSYLARTCISLFASSKEGLKELSKACRYVITSDSKADELNMDITLPKELKEGLGYFFARSIGTATRFKRMYIDFDK